MQVFTANCERCGHPVLADADGPSAWMARAVSIRALGDPANITVVHGVYDGYGGLVDEDVEHDAAVGFGSGATVWHEACWLVAGSPRHYRGESTPSADGWSHEDYDLPAPT